VLLAAQDNLIPVVAIIVSGIVAVAAPVIAAAVQHQLSKTVSERARADAQQERNEERRVDAYVDLLALLLQFQLWMDRTFPILGSMPDPPPAPTDEERWLVNVKLAAFGSDEIEQLVNTWDQAHTEFWIAVGYLNDIQEDAQGGGMAPTRLKETYGVTPSEQRRKIDDARQKARTLVKEIEARVAVELQGRIS
jgi:hypothetical protein